MSRIERSLPFAVSVILAFAATTPATMAQDAKAPAKPAAKAETGAKAEEKEAAALPKPLTTEGKADPAKAPSDKDVAEALTGDIIADTKFYYSIGRHDKALQMIESAPADKKDNPDLRFTKANILALRREWEAAKVIYEGLLPVWPDTKTVGGLQTRFNLAEVYYVLHDYEKALKLYDQIWETSKDKKDPTVDYLRYKMFLTNTVLNKKEAADAIFAGFDEYSLEPSFYYATAARAFAAGRVDEGKEWVRSAWNIYSEVLNNAFNEALLESGLVDKSTLEQQ